MVVLRIDGLEGVSSTIQLRGDRIKVVGLSLGVREKQYRSNTVNGQHSPCYGKSKRDKNALREAMNGFGEGNGAGERCRIQLIRENANLMHWWQPKIIRACDSCYFSMSTFVHDLLPLR